MHASQKKKEKKIESIGCEIYLDPPRVSNASSGQAAFEDNASGSFKPDIALSLKPDTVEDDDTNANVKHLKLRPMRPDGE